jgi:hypothetical protein
VQHVKRTLTVALAIVATAVPVVLADKHVQHFITTTPWLAAYFPLVSAVVYALYRATRERTTSTPGAGPVSSGSTTMGAKT